MPSKGTKIELRGREFEVMPLTLQDLEDLEKQLELLSNVATNRLPNRAELNAIAEIVVVALKENHHGITVDEVKRLLDTGNLMRTLACIMQMSGLEKTEGVKPGEGTVP